jgi:AmmeMemoRadiSam system protein A
MPHVGPRAAADVVIELDPDRVLLVRRKNPPFGWALPGGFIEIGEPAERAAAREASEETGLDVELIELFNVYSDPRRDPRGHTISVVFIARAMGTPVAGDDAAEASAFSQSSMPADLAFDHRQILDDYFEYRRSGRRPPPRPRQCARLDEADRGWLLRLARETIRSAIEGDAAPEGEPPPGPVREPAGAFVSLHRGGELRGCIGTFARDRPLHQVVRDMAVAAAFEDPRFPPLGATELAALDIEISVLSELRTADAESVAPGFHGVSVALGAMKGVFLPQVASEAGWDRETLLEQTCLKAGLPPTAWRDPAAEISVFTAEVFGDRQEA